MTATVTRREIEFSRGWIKNNFDLFTKALHKFHEDAAKDGLTVRGRYETAGYLITYFAD